MKFSHKPPENDIITADFTPAEVNPERAEKIKKTFIVILMTAWRH